MGFDITDAYVKLEQHEAMISHIFSILEEKGLIPKQKEEKKTDG